MVIVLVRHIDFSMKKVVELCVHDLTLLLVTRICIENSTKDDNVCRGAMMKEHWVQERAD